MQEIEHTLMENEPRNETRDETEKISNCWSA
jgi:hypothetical protein